MPEAEASMHTYWLPDYVRACPRIEGTVLLDLRHNRYFAISTEESHQLACIVPNWPPLIHASTRTDLRTMENLAAGYARTLFDAGLLSTVTPSQPRYPHQAEIPTTAVGEEVQGSHAVNCGHTMSLLRAYAWARHSIRHHSLETIAQSVYRMRNANEPTAPPSSDKLTTLVMTFRALRPLTFTAKNKCLVHSLALINFLGRYQVFPTWLVGVKLRPWGAHSWVQLQELVLDSTPEKVCDFTPILVV